MGELLKNARVVGGLVALIGGAVAFGVVQPDETQTGALVAVVSVLGGATVAAVVAKFAAKKGGDEAPKA